MAATRTHGGWLLGRTDGFAIGVVDPAGSWRIEDAMAAWPVVIGGPATRVMQVLQAATRSTRQRNLLRDYFLLAPAARISLGGGHRFIFEADNRLWICDIDRVQKSVDISYRPVRPASLGSLILNADKQSLDYLIQLSDQQVADIHTVVDRLG